MDRHVRRIERSDVTKGVALPSVAAGVWLCGPSRSSSPGKEHHNGTRTDDLRGYDFLIGRDAYYRLRPKDKVKNLPEDARVAFEKIPGGQPEVDFMGGTFFSVTWAYPMSADTWLGCDAGACPEPTRVARQPGDYLVEDASGGVTIVAAADVAVPDEIEVRLLTGPGSGRLPGPRQRQTELPSGA